MLLCSIKLSPHLWIRFDLGQLVERCEYEGKKFIFILGIMPRCGTNYLYHLLELHTSINTVGSIYEDFFVAYSDKLIDYSKAVFSSFGKDWIGNVIDELGNEDGLSSYLGKGIKEFVSSKHKSDQSLFLLTKTPSVSGIRNFSKIFPNEKLIILIRDGRSVVNSGRISFGWDFVESTRKWKVNAQAIEKFIKEQNNDYILIRYEDLYNNTRLELGRIFSYIGINSEKFDNFSAEQIPIYGSSIKQSHTSKVSWDAIEKTPDFSPLDRWKEWTNFEKRRFIWIAGPEMVRFQYIDENCAKITFFEWIIFSILDKLLPLGKLFIKIFRTMRGMINGNNKQT